LAKYSLQPHPASLKPFEKAGNTVDISIKQNFTLESAARFLLKDHETGSIFRTDNERDDFEIYEITASKAAIDWLVKQCGEK
jgi:hypothetical protein